MACSTSPKEKSNRWNMVFHWRHVGLVPCMSQQISMTYYFLPGYVVGWKFDDIVFSRDLEGILNFVFDICDTNG